MEKITSCGDNCLECPRYNITDSEELKRLAKLWYKIGWRDEIVCAEDMVCHGCSSHKKCTYKLVECIQEHGVKKCNQCTLFPCEKINDMLVKSKMYQKRCQNICSKDEYKKLEKAFFQKEENLKK